MRIEFKTEKRGYALALDQDLFGAFILYRQWWGLMNRRGGTKRQVFFDQDSAMREFQRIQKTRLRRGYVSVDRQSTIRPSNEHGAQELRLAVDKTSLAHNPSRLAVG